jgi:ATP-dependent Lhr-like helicase
VTLFPSRRLCCHLGSGRATPTDRPDFRPWLKGQYAEFVALKALLNNLSPGSTATLASLAAKWGYGMATSVQLPASGCGGTRQTFFSTTPESIEAILVSARIDHQSLLGGLRAVVVDELHAFAGDDRGWHLLAILARLERLAARTQVENRQAGPTLDCRT